MMRMKIFWCIFFIFIGINAMAKENAYNKGLMSKAAEALRLQRARRYNALPEVVVGKRLGIGTVFTLIKCVFNLMGWSCGLCSWSCYGTGGWDSGWGSGSGSGFGSGSGSGLVDRGWSSDGRDEGGWIAPETGIVRKGWGFADLA